MLNSRKGNGGKKRKKEKGKSHAKLLACRRHCTMLQKSPGSSMQNCQGLESLATENGKQVKGDGRKMERPENGLRNWNMDLNSQQTAGGLIKFHSPLSLTTPTDNPPLSPPMRSLLEIGAAQDSFSVHQPRGIHVKCLLVATAGCLLATRATLSLSWRRS
jgi:hypothetical protein